MNRLAPTGIVGGGTMGVGVAAVLAAAGRPVVLYDPDPAVRTGVDARLAAVWAEAGARHPAPVTAVGDLDALGEADLVLEAAPEDLDLKRALYADLLPRLRPDAVVASNTSSFTPDLLSRDLPDAAAARFLVAHFWNPPHRLPLVELAPGRRTQPAVAPALSVRLAEAGLRPVTLERAVPGFIGNRLQFALMREALALVEAGVATPEEVDTVVRFSVGRRWAATGPFEAADLGGLHIFLRVAHELFPKIARGQEGLATLAALVADGRTGVRDGRGFYAWTPERRSAVDARRSRLDAALETTA